MLETISLLASLNVGMAVYIRTVYGAHLCIYLFQIFEQTTIKDLRKKSLLLIGYMELLLKQNFSQTPVGEELDAKRPRIADRGLSLSVTW